MLQIFSTPYTNANISIVLSTMYRNYAKKPRNLNFSQPLYKQVSIFPLIFLVHSKQLEITIFYKLANSV
jgi:hypothetical protein